MKTVRVQNKSKRMYQHGIYNLPVGGNIEVPEDVAKIWLATGNIVEYISPAEAKKAEAKAAEEKAKLEAENDALKAEIEKLKAEAKKAEAKKK